MKILSRLTLTLLAIFLCHYGSLALANENPVGGWLGVLSRTEIEQNNLSFWQEFQWRQIFDSPANRQALFRFGPLYKLTANHELGLLYALINTEGVNEHRITQQFVFKNNLFSIRMRFEQRFLSGNTDMNLRYRALFRYDHPLQEHLKFVAWNESFLFLNNPGWVATHVFDRNRLFLGLRHQREKLNWEWGYLNQNIKTATKNIYEHVAVLYLFY